MSPLPMPAKIETKVEKNSPVEKKIEAKVDDSPPALSDVADFLNRTQTVVPLAVIGIFLIGFVYFIYFARPFLMPVVLALLLNFLLKPLVGFLARIKIRETFGALVVMLIFFGILAFAVSRLTEPATDWVKKAPENMRKVETKIRRLIRPATQLTQAAAAVTQMATTGTTNDPVQEGPVQPEAKQPSLVENVRQPYIVEGALSYTKSFLAGTLETIVLLYFLLASGDLFMRKLVKVLPTSQNKKKAVEIGNELQQNISTFLFTITVINTGVGLLVGLAMKLVGMPNPVLWGILAGLLNFIPYFGPITGVAVLSVAGFVTFDSMAMALLPPVIYLTLHALESNLFTPMILGHRLTLNPVMIFISLIFWTWIWGIPGALLSVPILMILKIFCDHFKPLAPFGEFMGD